MTDLIKRSDVIEYASKWAEHAESRICNDGSALDVRQKALLEAANNLLAWVQCVAPAQEQT